MKKNIHKLTFLAFLLIGMLSCTHDFENANTNPNKTKVGDITASGMFEPLLYNSVNTWQNYAWYWNNELIQFTAFTAGTTREEHLYKITDANWQSTWNFYARYANNAVHMYTLSKKDPTRSFEAIALTLKVLYLSNLTDMYGDIPYSEAFQGAMIGGILQPKFESQEEVYKLMFAELEEANTIYATNPIFERPALDKMYNGSMAQWRKFNNSLYLRLLNRVSGRSEMNVGAKVTQIINTPDTYPIFGGNQDNATVNFTGLAPYRNEFADYNEGNFTSSGRRLTQQLIKMTVLTQGTAQVYVDPRLPIFGKKNPNTDNPNKIWIGTVAGVRPAANRGTAFLNADVFCRADAPGTFMDYSEIQFILAELSLKGTIGGGLAKAEEYYEAGVKASMEKWAPFGAFVIKDPVTITANDITTFLNSDLGSWEKAVNKEELIANQKFLSLFWIGMEAYHEYRRTGYPILTIGDGATYNNDQNDQKVLPTRFSYPTITMATNRANAQIASKE